MSFAGTPLGQGRRLDQHAFLNKSHLSSLKTLDEHRAPAAATADHDTALVRYDRLKRERSAQPTQPPLNPSKWSVKDTSVNIAGAFNQAATLAHDMHPSNPNDTWVSASQTIPNIPRSTSVDYEKETHSTITRRLAPPPTRLSQRTSRNPIAKQDSALTHVSDSETDDVHDSQQHDRSARDKSPFDNVVDISKRVLSSATSFYMRPRSAEPTDVSAPNASASFRETSYDYASEEQEYQEAMRQKQAAQRDPPSRRPPLAHKRNRMSIDNKAYRPSQSDIDGGSDDDVSDDTRKRRRRTKKKDLGGGPLTTLPVVGYEKRRKKKRGSKSNPVDGDQEGDSSSDCEQRSPPQHPSLTRGSVARTSVPPPSRSSIPRTSLPPPNEDSLDVEVGLDSIPETDELFLADGFLNTSDQPSRSFSIGGILGHLVNRLIRFLMALVAWIIRILTLLFLVFGRILGSIFDIVFTRPAALFSSIQPAPFIALLKYISIAVAIYTAWHQLHDPIFRMLPSRLPHLPYYAPNTPITDLGELSARLQNIEAALSGLSLDQQRARVQQDLEARAHGDVVSRIFALEARIRDEAKHISVAEAHLKSSSLSSQELSDLKQEVQALQSHLSLVESVRKETATPIHPPPADEVARAQLKMLEERLGGVESDVADALEQVTNVGQASTNVHGSPWWSKLASIGDIKSTDSSDVTSLISQLGEAVARYGTRDFVSRADFALHSAGARPIPHLTSGTLELRPSTLQKQILGLITGHGYEVGRSPITALHQDLHSGNCWPMAGAHGQLGVMLAFPAIISDITIDHVAKEVAFDLSTAPREMEVWGQVDGQDNLAKVEVWREGQAARRQAAIEADEPISESDAEDVYTFTAPKDVPFIRLASFTYDIHASSNIQMFPVRAEVRDLDLDFGIVVLVVKNNWGKEDYTCLYRFRVHGERRVGA